MQLVSYFIIHLLEAVTPTKDEVGVSIWPKIMCQWNVKAWRIDLSSHLQQQLINIC